MPGWNANGSMPLRALSVSSHTSLRIDLKPLRRPSVNGEEANSAAAIGCSAERDPQLLDHVGFAGEVEVHLDRRRAVHHVEAARADLGHVARHDLVALLRHARGFSERPLGREPEAEKADAQLLADGQDLVEVLERFLRGLVQRRDGCTRQLELATGSRLMVPPGSPSGVSDAMMLPRSRIGSQPKRADQSLH